MGDFLKLQIGRKKYYMFVCLLSFSITGYAVAQEKCVQKKPNTLFSCQTFLSFVGGVEKGKGKLLANDFCFVETEEVENGGTYYSYRLDHTYDPLTKLYNFDAFSLTDQAERFEYKTSVQKNFLSYKNKLISCGFEYVSEDFYQKATPSGTYNMTLIGSPSDPEAPNYYIIISKAPN